MLITEGVGIDHPAALGDAGLGESNLPHLFGAEALAGWKRVVDGVHAAGGKVIPQLWHQGVMREPGTGPFPDVPSLRPSGLWGPAGRTTLARCGLRRARHRADPRDDASPRSRTSSTPTRAAPAMPATSASTASRSMARTAT